MGQCLGKVWSRYGWGRRRRRARHKAFEFAPKRSWKYTDATLLGQSDSSGGEEGALESSHASHVVRQPVTMVSQDSEEEEEVDTGGGEVRRSGLLAFSEDMSDNENDGEADGGFQTTPIHVPGSAPQYQVLREEESRDRTASNASQQIGRFEVMDITEEESDAAPNTSEGPAERAKLMGLSQYTPQLQATA